MPDATYPLLRRRRHRRLRLPRGSSRLRMLAIMLLCGVLVLGGIAVARRSERPDPARSFANALRTLAAGNYNAARSNAQKAVAAAPGWGIAHAVLARAYLELGDGLAAQAELTRAVDAGLSPARTHQLLAQARLLQGDPVGAIAETAKAPPRYAAYATRIHARALAAQGDVAGAQSMLVTLLQGAPRDAAAWTDLGRLRLGAGNIGGAADAAARAVALAPGEPAALTLQGEVVRNRYGLVAALPWFEAALQRDAYHYPALIEYAATLGDAGRNADALAASRRALATHPGSAQALYLQAVLAARAGRFDLSRRLLQLTGGTLDRTPGVMLLDGSLSYVSGRYEQAVATWRRLVAAQPMNIVARRLLAAALLRSGDPQGGADLLKPIALRSDADGYSLDLAARALEAAGERGIAGQILDRAATGGRGAAAIFASDDALGSLAAQAKQAPDDPTYALGVLRALVGSGDTAGAIAKARALVAATPGAPPAQLALGDTLAITGRYPEAASVYARAADLRFDEPTMLRLVDALGRTGRMRDAAAALALYLTQNPQSLTGQRLLGHWQVAAGQWNAGIETLEGVRRRVGNRDAGLMADLAFGYAGGGDGATARAYGRAAYALTPMKPSVADAYGVALAADGDVGAARQLLDKAVALAPDDRTIAAHRAQLSG